MESDSLVLLLKSLKHFHDESNGPGSFIHENKDIIIKAYADCIHELKSQNQIRPNRLLYSAIACIVPAIKASILANEGKSLEVRIKIYIYIIAVQ